MGNQTFKDFEEKPIGEGSMDGKESYSIAPVTEEEMTLFIKTKGITGGTVEYYDSDDKLHFKCKSKNLTLISTKGTSLFDKDDKLLGYEVSKTTFGGAEAWLYKTSPVFEGQVASEQKLGKDDETALYLAAHLKSKDTMTTSECTVKVVSGEDKEDESGFKMEQIMKGYKISTMGFNCYIEDMNGECLSKCTPTAKLAVKPKITIAKKTDPAYIFTATGVCAPGGSSAGALAGAGVV